MEFNSKTRELLMSHYNKYPQLQTQDIFKFLYQSSFGCEHMVQEFDGVEERILKEYENSTIKKEISLVERLDGAYSRVDLAYLSKGLSAATLAKLFLLSAKTEIEGRPVLESKLEVAKCLAKENLLPFSTEELENEIIRWQADGYPAVRHSDVFRKQYCPTYRVIADKYIDFLPLFAKIDTSLAKGSVILAIEGGAASGKTTLSEMLSEIYDATVFHMDDFFLRREQRTPERYATPGGNIDKERFLEEVLIPLKLGQTVRYRKFNCATMKLEPEIEVIPKKLTVIEGAYSMHPELSKYYDLSVFLDISPDLQKARLKKRNSPQMVERFYNEWLPLERLYFSKLNIKSNCDLSVTVTKKA